MTPRNDEPRRGGRAARRLPLRTLVVALTAALVAPSCGRADTVGRSVVMLRADHGTGDAGGLEAAPGAGGPSAPAAAPGTVTSSGSGTTAPGASSSAPVVASADAVVPVPAGRGGTVTPVTEVEDGPACGVGSVPRAFGLPAFYTKACVVNGLPVVASPVVDDSALVAAADILRGMLAARPDLARAMAVRRFRLGVIGVEQRAVDLPEYRDLPSNYPAVDWDAARAYGATPRRPLAAAPEENLVCSAADTYPGQSVLVHELGHSVLDMAVLPADPGFEARLEAAFRAAARLDVYRNTYALTNADEYWAEGVQDFFDASRIGSGPDGGGDGYDGPIHSRATLLANDPVLYDLIAGVFTESVSWRPSCPVR